MSRLLLTNEKKKKWPSFSETNINNIFSQNEVQLQRKKIFYFPKF